MKYSLNLTNLLIWPYLLSTNALASLNSTYRFNYTNFAQVANNSQTFQSNKSMYGPLSLDFNHFYFESDTYIVPASNKSNKKIYIAIDCSKSLLNVTDSNLNWREWSQAMVNFEKELIRDWCNR
ncbi:MULTISPECIES: hypothetical protein [Prochlorococcus]|uniref:hypothetical protein n=1 Tax=Prochlorococcus TaxID=1218 RepID=UPI0013E8F3CE|nr:MULTISPECIES: hypothetical protein [Prochlorococcus]